jgi:hypothetical protein
MVTFCLEFHLYPIFVTLSIRKGNVAISGAARLIDKEFKVDIPPLLSKM